MIQENLDLFASYYDASSENVFFSKGAIPYSLVVSPKSYPDEADGQQSKKSYFMTFMAIVHGNETGGMLAINSILAKIKSGEIHIDNKLCFVFGNIGAAHQGKRFVEYDMNRLFGSQANHSDEHARAKEIEAILQDTEFLFDIHQTVEPSHKAFFCFAHEQETLSWVQHFDTDIPSVMHNSGQFSADGLCSDEFVRRQGGFAVTVELGEKGPFPEQVKLGVHLAQEALKAAKVVKDGGHLPAKSYCGTLFMQDQKFYWQEGALLQEGFVNFGSVPAGTLVMKSLSEEFYSKKDGFTLFPKYSWPPNRPPAVLCSIIRPFEGP